MCGRQVGRWQLDSNVPSYQLAEATWWIKKCNYNQKRSHLKRGSFLLFTFFLKLFKSKSIKFFLLYSLYYAESCNEFAGPISASLRPGNTAPFEEISQQWRIALAKLCPIWPARDMNLRPPAPETNALPLVGFWSCFDAKVSELVQWSFCSGCKHYDPLVQTK